MTEVEPRSANLFVAGRAQRGIVNKFGNFATLGPRPGALRGFLIEINVRHFYDTYAI